MLTAEQIAQIHLLLDAICTPGLRKICAYCGTDLPGSDPIGARASHGICKPLCGPAKAMGWKEPEEAT